MTEQELKTIRESINYDVFGWKRSREAEYPSRPGWRKPDGEFVLDCDAPDWPQDPAAAMLVLEKCAYKAKCGVYVGVYKGQFAVELCDGGVNDPQPALPLAICLFAKKLFKP